MKKLVFIFLFFFYAPASALEVRFQENAMITAPEILLGDLAVFDEDSEYTRAMAMLAITKGPLPGEELSLDSRAVKNMLVRKHRLPRTIQWSGAAKIGVKRQGTTITPGRIEEIIARYLADNSHRLPDADLRFLPKSLPLPFAIPEGEYQCEVYPSSPGILKSSRFSLIFKVDGRVAKNMSVVGRVEAIAPVAVAAVPLKRDQLLKETDILIRQVDIATLSGTSDSLADYAGKRLKRNLKAGEPLNLAEVEAPPIIFRGERVKIIIKKGKMQLTATGMARSNGCLNQLIRVQNTSSNKVIMARVSAPGLVKVML